MAAIALGNRPLATFHEMPTPVREEERDLEEQKRLAIARFRRQTENARALCLAGDLDPDEHLRIKDQNEREIAHWRRGWQTCSR